MTEMQRHYLRSCLRSYAISFSISIISSFAMIGNPNVNPWLMAPIFGFSFGTVVILSHLVSHKLRHRSFLLTCLLQALAYVVVICASFGIAMWSYIAAFSGLSPLAAEVLQVMGGIAGEKNVYLSIFGSFLLMFAISSIFQVSKKLGPGVLWNWVTGKYHEPREETRIFMFLDLRDSTMLAEKLGNLRFSALVRDFFADMTEPVIESKAEVSHYIGDEAVLTWRLDCGLAKANCIEVFLRLASKIEARRLYYLESYGIVPGFKAGAHVGPVVATEVGDVKSEIVYHGDVLNTAARIQAHCSELGSALLISADLRDALVMPPGRNAEFKGSFLFKGKEHEIGVYAVTDLTPHGRGQCRDPSQARDDNLVHNTQSLTPNSLGATHIEDSVADKAGLR